MYHYIGWVLLGLLAISQLCNAVSTSPLWISSSLFKCDTVTFTYSTNSTTNETMTVTYSSAMTNSTLKNPVLGITDLQYIISSYTISLSVLFTTRTATSLTFRVMVNANSNLKTLKITYLAIDNAFAPAVSLNYYNAIANVTKTQPFTGYVNFTASTGVTLNMSHQNVLLAFINYLWIVSNNGQVDIDLDFSLANGSYYQLIITTQADMTLKQIAVSRMIFDKTAIEAIGNDYFDYGVVAGSNNTNILTTIPPDILPSNLFFGLHSFTIPIGVSKINYKSAYNISTGSLGLYPQTLFTHTQMRFSYFHHKSRVCPSSNPYYNISEKLCYDICASVYWFSDNSSMTCKNCLYDCLTCTNDTKCETCDLNVSYRQLNSSSRCVPIAGYYDDGTSNVAKPCAGSCFTCVSPGTSCLSCVSGSYISGSSCINCSTTISNCDLCNSSTGCTACKSTFTLHSATNCSCNSSQYLASGQCNLCSSAISRCISCSSATTCTACQSTFTLISASNCDCLTTQYINSSNLCRLCSLDITNCNSCNSATNCISCNSPFVLKSPTDCSCAIDHCINCTSSTDCIQCENYFIFKQGLCVLDCTLKDSKCNTCQINSFGQLQCLSCMIGYKLDNGICVSKPSQSESNGPNLLLILLPLLLGLLLCCCLILFCIWRRRKNEQNKVEEQNEGELQDTDPNNCKIDEIKVENLNESKDNLDEKVILKKNKYRGDVNKVNTKSKKRRMAVVQDTEANDLSVQQFKDTLKLKNQEKGNQHPYNRAKQVFQPHALPLNLSNDQKMVEEANQKQMTQKNTNQDKENSERASRNYDQSESNETKNNEESEQADGRGR